MLKNYVTYFMARLNCKKGQGMVEYGLILGLIAVVVIGIITTMGGHLKDLFTYVSDKIVTPAP